MLTADPRRRLLVLVLRFTGGVLITAFLAILLPVEWMASTHRALGMGEFPRAPVVDYLARSVAALYGFHGVLVLIVSGDPVRYRGIVSYLGIMNVLFGGTLLGIDLHAGLPMWWTVLEGPPLVIIGIVLTALNRPMRPQLRTV
ncbi:MAG: hypothetical protein ABW292_19320 [Vicinamibacterales bacterium]